MDDLTAPASKKLDRLIQSTADKLIQSISLFESAMASGDKCKAKSARAQIEHAALDARVLCKEKRRLMALKKIAASLLLFKQVVPA